MVERDGCTMPGRGAATAIFRHPDKPGAVTIPGNLGDEVPRGTWLNIQRQGRSPRGCAMKLTYAVVIEQTTNNYGAYASDVPGCISTADTPDEMIAMIREALTFHIEALSEDGDPVPEPTTSIDDAIAHHSQALSDADEELLAEYGDAAPTVSTRFELVEIEVSALQPEAV